MSDVLIKKRYLDIDIHTRRMPCACGRVIPLQAKERPRLLKNKQTNKKNKQKKKKNKKKPTCQKLGERHETDCLLKLSKRVGG